MCDTECPTFYIPIVYICADRLVWGQCEGIFNLLDIRCRALFKRFKLKFGLEILIRISSNKNSNEKQNRKYHIKTYHH